MDVPTEYLDEMKTFYSGIKRIDADNVQSCSAKDTGKIPLSYSDYVSLCRATLSLDDGGFAHLFLTMESHVPI